MPIIAYSYCRVSSEEQRKKGIGISRQKENAIAYCLKNNLILDSSYDEKKAFSAYSGANVTEGNLGKFLTDVRSGKIKGVLVTESADRLARTSPLDATQVINEILSYGIDIHIISKNKIYSGKLTNLSDVLDAILVSATAYEESKKKSDRSLDNWEKKRHKAAEKPMSKGCRGWLKLDKKTGKFIEIKPIADTIRQIFKWSIEGYGVVMIMKKLNTNPKLYRPINEKVGWTRNYVQKVLSSESVMGTMQPMQLINKVRVPIGEPILNYYPEVVDKDTFQLARIRASERKLNGNGRKGTHGVTNLFMGVIKCSCGSSIISIKNAATKRSKEQHYLICNSVHTYTGCKIGRNWDYLEFENQFFKFVKELDWNSIFESNETTSEKNNLINQISIQEQNKLNLADQYEKLKNDFENIPDDLKNDFFDNFRKKKQQIVNNEDLLKNLNTKLMTYSNGSDNGLKETIKNYEIEGVSDDKRIMLNELIRSNIKTIKLFNVIFGFKLGDDINDLHHNLLEICYKRGYKKPEEIEQYLLSPAGIRLYDQIYRHVTITFKNGVTRFINGNGLSLSDAELKKYRESLPKVSENTMEDFLKG